MERCFIIGKETKLYKDHKKYNENVKSNNKIIDKFMRDNGIEASEYCCISNDTFAIIPTESDKQKFGASLTKKDWGYGLRAFSKRSKIFKAYKNLNLNIVCRPVLWQYVYIERAGVRLFMLDDILYATLDGEGITPETQFPTGWNEIKQSEFYRILEEQQWKE